LCVCMSKADISAIEAGYLRHVDGLRGVSVLLVVLYHAWPDLLPGGFVGVDVFFVISGFLITRLVLSEQAAGEFRYGGFLLRRIRRLWPSFALVLIVTLGLGWILLEPDALADLGRSALAAMGFVSNWYFALTTDYFNEGLAQNFLLHSWSLAVEEQFYLFYPLVFIWLGRTPQTLFWALLTIWGVSFGAMLLGPQETAAFFATHLRVWQLASGALLWVGVSRGLGRNLPDEVASWIGVLGFALLLVTARLMPGELFWPSAISLLPVVGACLCIGFAWSGLRARWLVGLGLISYALYLWHWPLLKGFGILFPRASDGAIAAVIMASVGVSWLAWRYVEEPVRRGRIFGSQGQLLGIFAAVTLLFGVLGWQFHAKQGFASRFPVDIAAIANVGADDRVSGMTCTGGLERLERSFDLSLGTGETRPEFSVCWLGGDEPDFLYVGDSHLGALDAAIALRAKERGSNGVFFTLAACPPVPDFDWNFQGDETLRQCDMMKAVLRDVLATGRIKQAVLVGHWDIYGGKTETGLAQFNAAFERFAREVSEQTELHVLLDVPTHDFDVPQALLRERKFPWLGRSNWLNTAQHEAVRASYLALMREAAKRGVVVLHDPVPAFCPEDVCLAETADGPLFYDASHLSLIGTEFLLDALPDLPH
jgi:peptidoglycan/LPS O-acetylase OafA/YrhL